jgi:hypothetical protein
MLHLRTRLLLLLLLLMLRCGSSWGSADDARSLRLQHERRC